MPVYVETKDLPACLQRALARVEYGRKSIGIEAQERTSVVAASGEGSRSFCTLVDLDTGELSETLLGAWGGPTPFDQRATDLDHREHVLPPNGAVVKGHCGYKPYAYIIVHPSRMAKLLPDGSRDVTTERQRLLLGVYAMLNSRGRAEYFERHPEMKPEQSELEALQSLGHIKLNKSGAVTITASGRNHADRNICY